MYGLKCGQPWSMDNNQARFEITLLVEMSHAIVNNCISPLLVIEHTGDDFNVIESERK